MSDPLLSDEVTEALHSGRGVVALESAVLTCGLPRTPWCADHGPCPDGIDSSTPLNIATCLAMGQAVRHAGAVPALCGVLAGRARVGLDESDCQRLGAADAKASPDVMGLHIARGSDAGTTVGATLMLIDAAAAKAPRIAFFATGGIGGVHRGWQDRPDLSADLTMLRSVPCAVVCAGAKTLLDAQATCELLQTLAVPVLGLDCDRFPAFIAPGGPDAPRIEAVPDAAAAAVALKSHWALGGGGVILAQSPPAGSAMDPGRAEALARTAESSVSEIGAGRTPAVLSWMAEASGGGSLRANVDLLINNAAAAGRLAAG